MTARTTLIDKGRTGERDIPYFYAFKYRFWMCQSHIQPDDVASWCESQCRGYYKIVGYTHRTSNRNPITGKFDEKVVFVDKVYLSDDVDAVSMRLTFDVLEVKVHRDEKMERFNRESAINELARSDAKAAERAAQSAFDTHVSNADKYERQLKEAAE